ncbi:hypothetical protein BYT27DRAFT_7215085 [Phlegmacium glaucopus]|nr:hypothetical protein BYT27DRAFT_7215085 [Phlegmacium glaucopus]
MSYSIQSLLGRIMTWIPIILAFIRKAIWRIWDNVLLLRMGHAYSRRFQDSSLDEHVEAWREDQQKEWDRLSTTLGLLATMHAVILAIQPHAPPLAFAIWLAGAGLSVCGLPISPPISDQDILGLVNGGQHFSKSLSAGVVATPVIITLWASILFGIDIVDYLAENDFGWEETSEEDRPTTTFTFSKIEKVDEWGLLEAIIRDHSNKAHSETSAAPCTYPSESQSRRRRQRGGNRRCKIAGKMPGTSDHAKAPKKHAWNETTKTPRKHPHAT